MGNRIILGFGGNFKEARIPSNIPLSSVSPHVHRLLGNKSKLGRKERRRQREEEERRRAREFDSSTM